MIGRITSACGGIDWVHNKVGNKRIYGAWGDLRYDGNPGDGPNTQYCANLGHKKDDESGLTYMRARYYEPWTGRFINEDPARDGWNWFVYCRNNPTNFVDVTGRNPISRLLISLGIYGIYQTLHILTPALRLFAMQLSKASTGLEVEEMWSEFMDAYRGSNPYGKEGSLFLRMAGTALGIVSLAKAALGPLYYIGLSVSSLGIGLRGAFLCCAYQLRVEWYVNDIDNF